MPEQPVKGEMAIKRMMKRALGQETEATTVDEGKPLEKAQKITEQIIANEMIQSQLARTRAETAEAQAKAAKAAKEFERLQSGEEKSPESPFKVKGEVNMGTIDFQAREREAQAELKRLKEEGDKQNQTLGQINQQLRDEIHKKEMDIVQIGLQGQIQASNKRMEELIQQLGSRKNFLEEYTEAITTAKQLGVYNPQAGSDASVTIQLKKLEFEQSLELRRMMREEKRADREFQLQLRKYDDEREFRKADLERQKKRDEMLASTPEVMGRIIARGLVEGGGGEGSIEEAGPVTRRGKGPGIVAGVGESGEAECPQCQQPMAIGPTARVAVCANCGTKYPIKRVREQTSPVEEE